MEGECASDLELGGFYEAVIDLFVIVVVDVDRRGVGVSVGVVVDLGVDGGSVDIGLRCCCWD